MHWLGKSLLYVLSLGVVAYAVVGYSLRPLGSLVHPDMQSGFGIEPVAIYLHVFASAVALLLGPFQFSARLRRNHLQIHRWMGRIYLSVGVLLGGLSGLYISQFAFGGPVARLGFSALAVAWLYTGLRAYLAIRRRDIALHQTWMLRNFSLTFAAVMLRLYIPGAMLAGLDFATAYTFIAWLCWVPNLAVTEWLGPALHQRTQQPLAG